MPRIYWTAASRDDLHSIRRYIDRDSPAVAKTFVKRLITEAGRLSRFPNLGEVVLSRDGEEIRQILHGNYRLLYRVVGSKVEILRVTHAARLFEEE